MKRVSLLFLFLCTVAPPLVAQDEEPAPTLPERVDAVFSDYDSTVTPGCSLGVIQGGELVYARGYGMASLDHGVPLGPRSVFRIASTSKQFTAFAVQLLVDSGKVDLDADVRTYLPELPEYESPVTVRQLIHHTSGYRDYLTLGDMAGLRDDDYYTDAEVLDLLTRQRELNFAPNAEYLYSNSGYFLLGQIVLRASGKTLREFAAEQIFAPLGMRQTHFHDNFQEIVPQRAVGYRPLEDGGFEISQTTLEMIGDGGVFTTVEDLARWDANFYAPEVGTAATLERMHTPGVLNDGERLDYASGLAVSDYRGLTKVSHSGGFVGYRAQLIRFPDQRLSVICLCNRSDALPSRLAQEVADLYLEEELSQSQEEAAGEGAADEAVELTTTELEAFAGAYQREGELRVIHIELEEDGLVAAFAREARFGIQPVAANRFVGETWGTAFEVVFEGERAVFYYGPDRDERPYRRVRLAEPSAEAVASLAGDYHCDELMTTVRLRAEGSHLWLSHENEHRDKPEAPCVPTGADVFESDGFTLEVAREDSGGVEAVRLGAGRVRNIACTPVG
jgi:CubicO group peptidase (beta-lactamase class C family)